MYEYANSVIVIGWVSYVMCGKHQTGTMFQKGCHQTHGGKFVKSQPIFKILSPLERE